MLLSIAFVAGSFAAQMYSSYSLVLPPIDSRGASVIVCVANQSGVLGLAGGDLLKPMKGGIFYGPSHNGTEQIVFTSPKETRFLEVDCAAFSGIRLEQIELPKLETMKALMYRYLHR